MQPLSIVLPFCRMDGDLAIKNLKWMGELDGHLPFHCILSHDDHTPGPMRDEMQRLAGGIFPSVDTFWYPAPVKPYWPAAPNWAWQNVARYMAYKNIGPWLFMEADAVPIRKGWLHDIAAEHARVGKPFSGHIVTGMGHINGVAVYPPDVSMFVGDALRVEEMAWDVVIGSILDKMPGGILSVVHPSHELFQHCWVVDADGKASNGAGEVATFKSMNDVLRLVDVSMGIFHRCKDGSLIDWLRKYHRDPSAAMVPQHTAHDEQQEQAPVPVAPLRRRGRKPKRAAGSEDEPRHDNVVPMPVAKPENPVAPTVAHPKTEIFIVTFGQPTKRTSGLVVSDFTWLDYCLRAIRQHCRWFQGVTLAIPDRDADLLKPIATAHARSNSGIPLRIRLFKEPPGKGFLMHEVVLASADEFMPTGTEYVLHVDADVIFKERVTPDDYITDSKPIYVWRTYQSLMESKDGQKVVSDCYQWKAPTEAQLGFPVEAYTMARHPSGFPLRFYKKYRDHIEKVQGMPFHEYMLAGQNKHPQDRMDFTAMGAYAFQEMKDDFTWIDVSGGNHLAPPDKQRCYWSHGGVTDHIKAEIEGFLK